MGRWGGGEGLARAENGEGSGEGGQEGRGWGGVDGYREGVSREGSTGGDNGEVEMGRGQRRGVGEKGQ